MRKILGTIAATLAIVALMATSAGSALATAPGGSKSFVGPAGDAFFVDLADAFVAGWFEDHDSGDRLDEDGGLRSVSAELDVSGDKAVLVTAEPEGGSSEPASDPVLATAMT